MEQQRRGRGGLALPPTSPRQSLTIRFRRELRENIERAAILNGRSLSEEIEHRLERQLESGKVEDRLARLEAHAAGDFLPVLS